jgi:hypothetical protein
MSKRMLINGDSASRGPGSWPYHLGYEITNLAQSGAGNTYIHEATVSELAKRSYDAVTIMWPGPHRVDLQVTDIDFFADSTYTSAYQRRQNDWPEKIVYPINDQDYVDPNWIFGCGHLNQELALTKSRAFDSIYRYQSDSEFEQGLLIKMISLQNTLKQMNIPYLFTFNYPYFDDLKKHDLFKLLDLDSIYNDTTITVIMRDNNWYDTDGAHPGTQAYQAWAEIIKNIWQQKLM